MIRLEFLSLSVHGTAFLHRLRALGRAGHGGLPVASQADASIGADALLIVTEWREFKSPDFETLPSALTQSPIFDGRNLLEQSLLRAVGIEYHAIGRGDSVASADVGGAARH